jgi:hypothetical protein
MILQNKTNGKFSMGLKGSRKIIFGEAAARQHLPPWEKP